MTHTGFNSSGVRLHNLFSSGQAVELQTSSKNLVSSSSTLRQCTAVVTWTGQLVRLAGRPVLAAQMVEYLETRNKAQCIVCLLSCNHCQ